MIKNKGMSVPRKMKALSDEEEEAIEEYYEKEEELME